MTARADFFRNLPSSDFCPPEGAVADAVGRPLTADSLARRTADTAEAVDEFAAGYWNLDPAERQAEWTRLAARPADAPTTAFLTHLKGGLKVGPTSLAADDFVVGELSGLCRELFTLRPRARATRRLAWLDTRESTVDWSAAVGKLWATDPATAELDPPLVTFLDAESPPPTSVRANGLREAHSIDSGAYGRAYTVDTETAGRGSGRPRRRREPVEESSSGSSPWLGRLGIGGVVVVIIIIIRVVAACAGASRSPTNTPSYTPSYTLPTYSIPTFRYSTAPNVQTGLTVIFNTQELRAFEAYEALPNGNGPKPPRYDLWVQCRRPSANKPVKPYDFR